MAERNGAWLAAMLPANSQLDLRTHPPAVLNSYPYESTHAFGVKNLKRIIR